MKKTEETEVSVKKKDKSTLPPWVFQHQDLIHDIENSKKIFKKALINRLNHINFIEGYVLAHLYHAKYEENILIKASPEPCLGEELTCRWSDGKVAELKLENYIFRHLIIADSEPMVLIPAELLSITGEFLRVCLPDKSYSVGKRQARRYAGQDVIAELTQNGFVAKGKLIDFSPDGFRIGVKPESFCTFHWFNSDALFTINLRRDQQILFSGVCRCVRQQEEQRTWDIAAIPIDKNINRFKREQNRNPRLNLTPSPILTFRHPLIDKIVRLDVSDMSTSGFSVNEEADEGVLMPGMIIPEMTINFAGALKMKCLAQVIYRSREDENSARCGLAALDMDIGTYSRLAHIVTNVLDPHARVSGDVDVDELWEFFFNTGFIYPKKYGSIEAHRDDFKETYRKLYQEYPEIAKSFTCQKNGRIHGHISMVRAYERTWLIQHHAATAMNGKPTGLMVLKQVMHYLHDIHHLPSAKIDYVMVYFRPEKKFPDRIFGGFARSVNDKEVCSLDLFSYLSFQRPSLDAALPEGWSMDEFSERHLWEISRFYNNYSGGLMIDALGLNQKDSGDESIEEVFGRLGFLRKRDVYALNHKGDLNAVMIADQSEQGMNLSELLNSIKILITNSEGLPWNVLSLAIAQLSRSYSMDSVPALIYPFEYVEANNIPYEKRYNLMIYNARFFSQFIEHMQRKFRAGY